MSRISRIARSHRHLAEGANRVSHGSAPLMRSLRQPGIRFQGRRWTIKAAIDEGVPVPVLSTALYSRFTSRGEAEFADKLLSAMRFEFGGHIEKLAEK